MEEVSEMISSRKELNYYLFQDKVALYRSQEKRPKVFGDEIWKWEIIYRKYEYYTNTLNGNPIKKMLALLYKIRYHRMSIKLGFSIPINVFGPGLSIAHYGYIVVNKNARIGKNCRIHEGVTIGATSGSTKAPVLGNNVFIGSGATIIGDISIASDIAIGANAAVVKSFSAGGVTLGGVPAKVISRNNSHAGINSELMK